MFWVSYKSLQVRSENWARTMFLKKMNQLKKVFVSTMDGSYFSPNQREKWPNAWRFIVNDD